MASAIHAVYEHGVFRPVQPVDLPDGCEVEVEIRALTTGSGAKKVEFHEESPTTLSDRDQDRFLELLENPPPPNAALRKAIALHRKQPGFAP
jgi:predicted DNA-binding antitoxin AbrB/MazE fold protein